jgi:hypothetical protein
MTVQTSVTSSNQCLHLFHTYQLVKLLHYLIYGRACPVSIKSSTALRLFWVFSPMFIFAFDMPCTYGGWNALAAFRRTDSSALYTAATQLGPTSFYKAARTHIHLSATFSSNYTIQQVQS